ncbi:MAG: hypothetical protein ABI683_15010 [Ginsengibacter sp.]
MKKTGAILAGLFSLLFSIAAKSQTKTGADYFAGSWDVFVKGLPDGDTKMIVNLQRTDTAFVGAISDSTGKEISKFSNIELKDTTVTVYFTAQGYDVNLEMNKKDDDHTTGSLMGMFDAEGERRK